MKQMIDGFMAGAGGQYATKFLGAYGHPAGAIGVGWFRKNQTLILLGARELGAMVTANVAGGGETPGGFVKQG